MLQIEKDILAILKDTPNLHFRQIARILCENESTIQGALSRLHKRKKLTRIDGYGSKLIKTKGKKTEFKHYKTFRYSIQAP